MGSQTVASQEALTSFEPTVFPDLTGLSPSVRKSRHGYANATHQLNLGFAALERARHDFRTSADVLIAAAWAKVLAAYLGEGDVCVNLLRRGSGTESVGLKSRVALRLTTLGSRITSATTNFDLVRDLDSQAQGTSLDQASGSRENEIDSIRLSDSCVEFSTSPTGEHSPSSAQLLNNSAVHLHVQSISENQCLQISLRCRRSLILEEDILTVVTTFEDALESVVHSPTTCARSWTQCLSGNFPSISNATYRSTQPDHGETVHASIAYHAERKPENVALDFLELNGQRTTWTFRQLQNLGTRIAEVLIADHGVCVEDSVPVCVPKSPAFYACILGVMMSGAAFTPFSGSPEDRKKLMLEELGSKVILCVDGEDISWCQSGNVVNVSFIIATPDMVPDRRVQKPVVRANNLVYHMYTSGSTGRPKAVSLEHGNALQTVSASKQLIPWTQSSRMLQYAAPSFDMCYYDTFLAWYLGICLCSASSEAVYNDLPGVINTLEATLLGLTPSVAATLDPEQIPVVEWLYCIGEAMPQSLVDTWQDRLVNSYGPTEAAQMVTLFAVKREIKSAVIGIPFPNTTFQVLQKDSVATVPVLGIGELCIGGLQVARGYFANEEKTRNSFIIKDGIRLYRTGDNVRMLGNGTFEFVGRTDDQVKIRGQRVELGEINAAIKDATDKLQIVSCQIMKISESSKEQLVAFAVTSQETSGLEQGDIERQVTSSLEAHLPSYMHPKMYCFVEKIPLSPSGKVDRKALLGILRERSLSQDNSTVSSDNHSLTSTEAILRDAFATFAAIKPSGVGRDVSIYHLGLDSISAIQMATALRDRGLMLDASDILHNPTTRRLAQAIDERQLQRSNETSNQPEFDFAEYEQRHREAILQSSDIDASEVSAIRPASALQAGMIAQSIHSSGEMYFNHMTYEFSSGTNPLSLINAWDMVIDKYEILRSGFAHVEDPKHTVAMITYHMGGKDSQRKFQSDEDFDVDVWRQDVVRTAMNTLQLPPWRALIQRGKLHLSAHHALYDAQVLDLIFRDLEVALDMSSLSQAPSFEPQLAKLLSANADRSSSADFWKSIGETTFVTRFPVLTPLKVVSREFNAIRTTCHLSRQKLEKGCRHHGITMQVAGQAAWGRLLSAYTGEHEVTFGTVLSGRTTADSDEVGFPCITTVPTPTHAGETKKQLLESLMVYNASIQRHQFVPLKTIERLTGHKNEALFDTLFTYQKRALDVQEKSMFRFLNNDLTIDYPLSVELEPVGQDALELTLYHRLDKVPVEHAQLIIDQFDRLLCEVISERIEWDAPNVREADQRLYSITAPEYPSLDHEAKLLHEFVEISAREGPDKAALEFVYNVPDSGEIERKSWSYRELISESNKIANLLIKHNVTQGSVVAVCFDKCPEAAFTMLAISRLGCSFLALDSGAPLERKKFIMGDSKSSALVTKGTVVDGLDSQIDAPIVNLDDIDTEAVCIDDPKLSRSVDLHELSYCLYTSGTTGTPKGCAITHENVVQAFLSFHKLYRWNNQSRWLQFASYHFDVSVMEHFWSWSVGMTVVVASRDLVFADLPGTIKKLEITHTDLTPSLARLLDPEDVPSLAGGVFVTGGEMLRQEVIDKFGPYGAIHNAYGPTEATIGCTMYPGVPKDGRPSNIGWHFPVAGSFIVDPQNPNIPVLRGAVGEFVVSGKLVAQGYIGRPDLTKERFITLDGQKCYRTGDLVRILHNKTFDFIGRADDQVKLRGQRLEIGEINSVIKSRDAGVVDVTTQVLKHPKQQKDQLITFVVVSAPGAQDHHPSHIITKDAPLELLFDLKRACQEKLPQYMIPTHILPVNKLPLSANNKADAKQLKALYEKTSLAVLQKLSHYGDSTQSDERSKGEQKRIERVLSRLLDVPSDQISGSVSFFELGLDSISVIGFARSLRNEGLMNVSTAVIMENSTSARLAHALSSNANLGSLNQSSSVNAAKQKILACQHRYKRDAAVALSVSPGAIESLAPCTPLQQGIISRALKSNNKMYYGAFHFQLRPEVDVQKLHHAFQTVMSKVQILRTKFVSTNDGYVQVVLRDIQLPWQEADVVETEHETYLQQRFDAWRLRNEDLISEPVQVLISKFGNTRLLSLHIFHACYDGNSLPLLLQAVLNEYHESAELVYGPQYHEVLPYGPLCEPKDAKEFWMNHLRPSIEIKQWQFKPLSEKPSSQPISISARIEPIEGLEECRRKLNVTHQALLQACWGAVLQHAASKPIVQGIVVSGRSIDFEGADRTVGPLFNTIPFLLHMAYKDSWQDLVRRCHDFNSAALPFQHTSLRQIQKWTAGYRQSADIPLFETLFVFQKGIKATSQAAIWELRSDHFEADYPLALEAEQTWDGAFNLTLVTQSGISDENTSSALLRKLQEAVQILVENSLAPVSDSINIYELSVSGEGTTLQDSEPLHNGHFEAPFNGQTDDHSNGHGERYASGTSPKANGFQWTPQRTRVRDEIANLAGVDAKVLLPQTSILELGLDSVDAVKLSSRLKQTGNTQMSLSAIMRTLSVGGIADLGNETIMNDQKEASSDKYEQLTSALAEYARRSGLKSSQTERVLPSTPLQEGMIADMLTSELTTYFNHDIFKLRNDVDIKALKQAWQDVVQASPVLRTRFVEVEDPSLDCTVAQVIHMKHEPIWSEVTIHGEEDFDDVLEVVRQQVSRDLYNTPPFRLTLLRTSNSTDTYLALSLSHAMYDGWSLALLHADVHSAYQGSLQARPRYEPALRKILHAVGQTSQNYWQQALQDTTPSLFPSRQESSRLSSITHRSELQCDETASEIQRFCKNQKTTLAAFSQTIWAFVLASRLKQLDVAFATVLSGRDDEHANDVLFPTMNTVIARTVLHGTPAEMMHYIQSNLSAVSEHQHYPLRKALAIAKGRSDGELVNSLFIFQRRPNEAENDSQALYESVRAAADEGIPVAVEAEVSDGSMTWRIAAKDTHLSKELTESLLQDLKAITSRVIADPHADAVTFEGAHIRICGLPPFKGTSHAQLESRNQAPSDDEETNGEWTEAEIKVQSVVAMVARLDKSDVQRKSSLLRLGLDSISAIKVSALLRKSGLSITVNELLKAETVAKIAKKADQDAANNSALQTRRYTKDVQNARHLIDSAVEPLVAETVKKSGLQSEDIVEVLPATSSQMLMLSKWQSEGLYLPTLHFVVQGFVAVETVAAAWTSVLEHAPILRTVFASTGDENIPILQLVLKHSEPAIRLSSDESFDSHISALAEKMRNSHGGAIPAALLLKANDEGGVEAKLKLSHALYDGYSIKLIFERLQTLLEANTRSPGSVPAKSLLYRDFIGRTISGKDERQAFWSRNLSKLRGKGMPRLRDVSTKRHHIVKPNTVVNVPALHALVREKGLTIQSVFLAAYAQTYATISNAGKDDDTILGAYVANRNFESADELDAPTLGFVPLRVQAANQRSVIDLAQQIQQDLRTIAEDTRGSVTMHELRKWLGPTFAVDTWVNLILEDEYAQLESDRTTITFGEDRTERNEEHDIACNDTNKAHGLFLSGNTVQELYQESIDIDGTISAKSLDIGILAPNGLANAHRINLIIGEISARLKGLLERPAECRVCLP